MRHTPGCGPAFTRQSGGENVVGAVLFGTYWFAHSVCASSLSFPTRLPSIDTRRRNRSSPIKSSFFNSLATDCRVGSCQRKVLRSTRRTASQLFDQTRITLLTKFQQLKRNASNKRKVSAESAPRTKLASMSSGTIMGVRSFRVGYFRAFSFVAYPAPHAKTGSSPIPACLGQLDPNLATADEVEPSGTIV